MATTVRDDFVRLTSWMGGNVMLVASIYRTKDRELALDPSVYIDDEGYVARQARYHGDRPPRFVGWEASSVAALTCCCYIDALGKVSLHGTGTSSERFITFVSHYIPEIGQECDHLGAPYTIDELYRRVRCGLVHQFADENLGWTRSFQSRQIWVPAEPDQAGGRRLFVINVDGLVERFLDGLDRFRYDFNQAVERGECSFEQFFEWLARRAGTP